jgi:hypothetical protein
VARGAQQAKGWVGLELLAQSKVEIEEAGPRRRRYPHALAVVTARSAPAMARRLPVAERPRCGSAGWESLRVGQGMCRAKRVKDRRRRPEGGGEWEPIKIPHRNLAYDPKSTRRPSLLTRPRLNSYSKAVSRRNRARTAGERFRPRNLKTLDPTTQGYNRASPAIIHTQEYTRIEA